MIDLTSQKWYLSCSKYCLIVSNKYCLVINFSVVKRIIKVFPLMVIKPLWSIYLTLESKEEAKECLFCTTVVVEKYLVFHNNFKNVIIICCFCNVSFNLVYNSSIRAG
uniref:Uncharacterized protein n=2 Tax=Epichloe TaxID=5112 RepID=A0A1J0D0E6_EPINE|nr:hypothetical protein [Epichloe festucae]APB96838.1 hypothetical protein [Epichloe festucae]APB96898.1 hypothetical protein [Epichloe hybrida]